MNNTRKSLESELGGISFALAIMLAIFGVCTFFASLCIKAAYALLGDKDLMLGALLIGAGLTIFVTIHLEKIMFLIKKTDS